MDDTISTKILYDEDGNKFFPITATSALVDPIGRSLDTILNSKLELPSLVQGSGIVLTKDNVNNTVVIASNSASLNLIDNLTTASAEQGALDAHQGYVLKGLIDAVPVVEVIDNLTTVDGTKALSAYQGYLLSNKFNDYAKLDTANTFTANQTVNGNITTLGGSIYAIKTDAEVAVSANYNNTNSIYLYANSSNAGIWSSYGRVCSNDGSGWYFNGNCSYADSAGSATTATSAGSANTASSANSSTVLASTGTNNNSLSYYQTSESYYGSSASWAHYIIASHGDGATYYNYMLRLPFWGPPQFQRQEGNTGNRTGWFTLATTSDLPTFTLSGTTLYITT